jgi:hypothetical protein
MKPRKWRGHLIRTKHIPPYTGTASKLCPEEGQSGFSQTLAVINIFICTYPTSSHPTYYCFGGICSTLGESAVRHPVSTQQKHLCPKLHGYVDRGERNLNATEQLYASLPWVCVRGLAQSGNIPLVSYENSPCHYYRCRVHLAVIQDEQTGSADR